MNVPYRGNITIPRLLTLFSSAYESDESYEEKLPVHTEGRLCYSLDYNPTDCHLTVDLFKAKYLKGKYLCRAFDILTVGRSVLYSDVIVQDFCLQNYYSRIYKSKA